MVTAKRCALLSLISALTVAICVAAGLVGCSEKSPTKPKSTNVPPARVTFTAATRIGADGLIGRSSGFLFTDLNGDSLADVAICMSDSQMVWIRTAGGGGEFNSPFKISAGVRGDHLIAGDFTGDGLMDIVVGGASAITILPRLPAGGYSTPDTIVTIPDCQGVDGLASGDFDNSGSLSLAALVVRPASIGPPYIDIHLLVITSRGISLDEVVLPGALVAADITGDGNEDLCLLNGWSFSAGGFKEIEVHIGRGDGTFQDPIFLGVNELAQGLVAARLGAGDSVALCVGQDQGPGELGIFAWRNGSVTCDGRYAAGSPTCPFAASDFDRDGHPDVAAGSRSFNTVGVLLGMGNWKLAPAVLINAAIPWSQLGAGDVDGDGWPDLLLRGGNDLWLMRNTTR